MPVRTSTSNTPLPLLCIRCAWLLVPWLWQLFFADLVLSLLLPISFLLPDLCYSVSSRVAERIWRGIQRIFTVSNHARIVVSGVERLPKGESAIVISNHVGWSDFYMVQEVAERAGMLSRCRWFAKGQLKWVPFLGWGLWALRGPLVSRDWTHDKKQMDRVFRGVVERKWPIWLVAYSEATRYTSSKRLEAEAWCRANGKCIGHHLLYPRTRGFVACAQNLRRTKHVSAVYDLTIAYADSEGRFQAAPSFVDTILLPHVDRRWRCFVHVERHPLNTLPEGDENLAQWLENAWVQKGERLERLRRLLEVGKQWDDSSLSRLSLN